VEKFVAWTRVENKQYSEERKKKISKEHMFTTNTNEYVQHEQLRVYSTQFLEGCRKGHKFAQKKRSMPAADIYTYIHTYIHIRLIIS